MFRKLKSVQKTENITIGGIRISGSLLVNNVYVRSISRKGRCVWRSLDDPLYTLFSTALLNLHSLIFIRVFRTFRLSFWYYHRNEFSLLSKYLLLIPRHFPLFMLFLLSTTIFALTIDVSTSDSTSLDTPLSSNGTPFTNRTEVELLEEDALNYKWRSCRWERRTSILTP